MNDLELAVVHDAKNKLCEAVFRLEARGDCFVEIESIIHASNSLTNLIIWHRQQSGAMHINIDSASPKDLLDEVVAEFTQFFPSIIINCEMSDAPEFWFYDEASIRLALVNALHNACRFAKSKVQLSVSVCGSDNQILFTVRDDGAGYDDEVLLRYSQHKLAEVSLKGTGVGLMLSSSLAFIHVRNGTHGQVTIYNDNGAVFEMRLP